MSNSYTMEYGYQSLIYPARMFKTREDAESFDVIQSLSTLTGFRISRDRLEALACGTIPEADEDDSRVLLAAMRWIVNAADDAERTKRIAKWEAEKKAEAETPAIVQAAE